MFNDENEFKELRFILNSQLRSKVLIHLFYGDKNLDDLRLLLDKPSSTVLHTLQELILLNLVEKRGKSYNLSSLGYVFALIMFKFLSNLSFIKKNKKFLENHSINSIPKESLKELYLLINGSYYASDEIDSSKPLNTYLNIIDSAKVLNIILPIFSKIHLDEIIKVVSKEDYDILNLITSDDILKSLNNFEYIRKLNRLSKSKSISVWKVEGNLDIFLTFNDDFSTLGFFFDDGQFDNSIIFVDKSESALKWSNDLFDYYIEHSNRVI